MRAGVYRVPTDYRVQRPPDPMSDLHRSFVRSIEKFSIAFVGSDTSKQVTLTKGQNLLKWPSEEVSVAATAQHGWAGSGCLVEQPADVSGVSDR